MAKSIEQKAVDTLVNALSDTRFRNYEFSRLMVEESPLVHKQFFVLITSYLNYIATYADYNWYPNGTQEEAELAREVVDIINAAISP